MNDSDPKWHPLSQIVHSVIEASAVSLDARALAVCVGVEGVLRAAFGEFSRPSKAFSDEISKAQELIKGNQTIAPRVRTRIDGALGQMKDFRVQRGLDGLLKIRAVTPQEASAWGKLRHKSAHADRSDAVDLQAFLDLCSRVAVLSYRLIFTAIGYEGAYTDYGSGWSKQKHARISVEGLANPTDDEVTGTPSCEGSS